ncbi:unnamed protein product, partial [Chrysoparadoxa australica]
RYLKGGRLYESYDPITSTEKFYEGIDNQALGYIPPTRDPPKIKDDILLLGGPDKGKTGRITFLWPTRPPQESIPGTKKAIVKLDSQVGGIREIKVVPYNNVAKLRDEK